MVSVAQKADYVLYNQILKKLLLVPFIMWRISSMSWPQYNETKVSCVVWESSFYDTLRLFWRPQEEFHFNWKCKRETIVQEKFHWHTKKQKLLLLLPSSTLHFWAVRWTLPLCKEALLWLLLASAHFLFCCFIMVSSLAQKSIFVGVTKNFSFNELLLLLYTFRILHFETNFDTLLETLLDFKRLQ